MIVSLRREVLPVQLDGLRCRLFTGERQNYNPSDPRGCGMPLKTCGENRFLWPQSSDLYFTVWGELTCGATSGAGCVCTNFPPPPPPPPADSHNWSDESRIPLLLNSSKHRFQTAWWSEGKIAEEGGRSGPAGETNAKRTECVF